ncbi:MAG: SH3 domain-containing protein, partial [Anaerolineae bacterium]|nr:SH3 domain-containing protein [Anaerolineae bacterium]
PLANGLAHSGASATPSPTFTPEGLNAVVTAQALNVRNGPGDNFDVIGHLIQGDVLPILGTDASGFWLLVQYSQGTLQGWIATTFTQINGELTNAPNMQPTPLPNFVRLDGITYLRQAFNNCAPTALTMALTYYGGTDDQMVAASYLRPNTEQDVSVDISQMSDYVNLQFPGLRSVWRMGGSWTTLRRLLAAGFPVIIETSVEVTSGPAPGWAGHNRLLIGYDGDVILTYDSYLGSGNLEGYRVAESTLDELWRQMNRQFQVIYPVEREAEVAYIMGEDWLIPSNIEKSHRVALAEMAANPSSAFALYNLGTTYVMQGLYTDAAAAYDQAQAIGLPFRMHWYQFGMLEAYYNVGRYNEVIDITRRTLNNMGNMATEELYYWLGMATRGAGNMISPSAKWKPPSPLTPTTNPR